ncbi:alpha/beta hydrolase [Qipengyuania atrilutea]|uniref:Alpha/beta hydrolase n=1 Tax=Qipengyuania atrilutea TaxID=2744473 RepID=A0A850HBR8_9SPHN|nr:alpha/beta hydrolase [Actirhodobacter atriluteus]NVD44529.1 alpha/beta hydrolase [Actirhodobacter atriluteus]
MIWFAVLLAALLAAGFFWLQSSVSQNGPAVLDRIDRLTGGNSNIERAARVSYGPHPAQTVAVYRDPAASGPQPVILFVHGGGWHAGSPDDYGFAARNLAKEGFVVVLSGYRLYPDARFPAMLEDTADALQWTSENVTRYGGDADRIYLAGHSAGAYNAVMLALDPQWLEARGLSPDRIAGAIGIAGPYDFLPFDTDSTRNSFGEADNPEATQPIAFARGDAPPLLLMTGTEDTVVEPRNTKALAEAMEDAGGAVTTAYFEGMDHNRIIMALASPFSRDRRVLDAFGRFADETAAARTPEPSVPVQDPRP